jgi:hypothetical protein
LERVNEDFCWEISDLHFRKSFQGFENTNTQGEEKTISTFLEVNFWVLEMLKTMTPVELCAWIDKQVAKGKLSQAARDAVRPVILSQQLTDVGLMNMTYDQWTGPNFQMLGGHAHELLHLKHVVSFFTLFEIELIE